MSRLLPLSCPEPFGWHLFSGLGRHGPELALRACLGPRVAWFAGRVWAGFVVGSGFCASISRLCCPITGAQ